eukprot:2441320-Karenia_brevis.AAC.1
MVRITTRWDNEGVGKSCVKSRWGLGHSPHPWARVKGPTEAMQMNWREIGWQARWHNSTFQHSEGQIWQPNPKYGMGILRPYVEDVRL